jgi:hypothetical protein
MMSWQKDGRYVDHDNHYSIQKDGGRSSLRIEESNVKDSAWYQCTAVNVAGTASNRAKLTVQPQPRRVDKTSFSLPRRTTPTHEVTGRKAETSKRPHSVEAPKTARAEIVLSPTPPPTKVRAQQAYQPDQSELLKYIHEQDQQKPVQPVYEPMDSTDFRPPSLAERPSTKELINQGLEPQPGQEDLYDKDNPRPPMFKTTIRPQSRLMENEAAIFEGRLVPIGDPDMRVEWFKDGQPLTQGSRFVITNDF